jgi:hypothetical protein
MTINIKVGCAKKADSTGGIPWNNFEFCGMCEM